jgi:hypothetical protein
VTDAVGTAPNVDLREADDRTPFDDDGQRRIISCCCCTCEESATVLAEPGRSHEWEHARRHPTHVVDYWRVDG